MAQMEYTAANIRPLLGALVENKTAGAACSVGQCVYADSSGYVQPADANDPALGKGIGIIVGNSDSGGSTDVASGRGCSVCLLGPVAGWTTLTPGTYGYVGETAGQIVDTAPSGGAYQYCMGYALTADTFFVLPGVYVPVSA